MGTSVGCFLHTCLFALSDASSVVSWELPVSGTIQKHCLSAHVQRQAQRLPRERLGIELGPNSGGVSSAQVVERNLMFRLRNQLLPIREHLRTISRVLKVLRCCTVQHTAVLL